MSRVAEERIERSPLGHEPSWLPLASLRRAWIELGLESLLFDPDIRICPRFRGSVHGSDVKPGQR